MKKLRLPHGVLSYIGLFAQPTFPLWKMDGVQIVEEVYKLFSPFDVSLSDISLSFDLANPEDTSITVSMEDFVDFTLGPARLQCEVEGFANDRIEPFFESLQMTDGWLRGSDNRLKYSVHYLEFAGHGSFDVEEGTAQEFLSQFDTKKLNSIGQSLPGGLIFNWIDQQTGGRSHIEIDHSLDIPEALYVRWLVMLGSDRIDYKAVGLRSIEVMSSVLAELGLEIEERD